MKHFALNLIILILIISFGCSDTITNPKSSFNLTDTVQIKYTETIYNETENISLTFDSIISDSRCPIGVVCFWEGDAEIGFIFSKLNNSTNFSLHTYYDFTNDTTIFNYNIKLVSVEPHPHVDSTYSVEQYQVEVVIVKE